MMSASASASARRWQVNDLDTMNTWKEMETRSALPVRALNANQRCNFGSSGIFPSSLPVVPNTSVKRFPKLSDPEQVPVETGMMADALAFQYTPFVSNGGYTGPMYSTPSGIAPDHFSSVLSDDSNRDNAPLVRRLGNAGVLLPAAYSPYTETFQVPTNSLSNDPTEVTWCLDSDQGSLIYSHEITGSTRSRQILVPDDDLNKQDEWWSGVMSEDWKDLLKGMIATEPQPQVVYPNPTAQTPHVISEYGADIHQYISRHSNELGAVTSQLSAATTTAARPRMTWSMELHERFVDAVNQLGGGEKATPKGILNIMKVEDLTISHVKSHLQKFRTACCRPHTSEGMPEKKTESEDLPSLNLKTGIDLTEALRIQMEVQKRLHEQLEEQRKLQMQIEKQGRCLQEMIEKQCKSTMQKFHAPPTMEESATDETASAAKIVHTTTGTSCSIDSNITEERLVGDKRKMPEFEPFEDDEPDAAAAAASPPQHKRAKTNNGDYDDEFQ